MANIADSPSVVDKEALQDSYKERLSQLGLLQPRYEMNSKNHLPEFDRFTGGLKIRNYNITALGRLLLKQIGLSNPEQG